MNDIGKRKQAHLKVDGLMDNQRSVFENYKLRYTALPELDFAEIKLESEFLGYKLDLPFMVSSMSGGVKQGNQLNEEIAKACNQAKVAFASGSIRVALENPGLISAFDLKGELIDVPYLLNIGAYQLKDDKLCEQLISAIRQLKADGLFIHLNPLQEAVQAGGDKDWRGVKRAILDFVQACPVLVFVKEVGHGLHPDLMEELVGVAGFDVSGLGGLSWGQVEARLQQEDFIAQALGQIGYPTPWLLQNADKKHFLIAGGGVRSGIDILKSIILGANLATAALPVKLAAEKDGQEGVVQLLNRWQEELRVGLFALGEADLSKVRGNSDLLLTDG